MPASPEPKRIASKVVTQDGMAFGGGRQVEGGCNGGRFPPCQAFWMDGHIDAVAAGCAVRQNTACRNRNCRYIW